MVDRIIKDWFLITFCNEGRKVIGKALYGTLIEDKKGRFRSGVEVKSSPIESEVTEPGSESRVFQTLNSIWECVGKGVEIDEPHTSIPFFNQGVRPPYTDLLKALGALEVKGYEIVDRQTKPHKESMNEDSREAASRVLQTWGLNAGQRAQLLDDKDQVIAVISVFESLQLIFSEDKNRADEWLSKPNEAFDGTSALEVLLNGDIEKVRQHLKYHLYNA